MSTRSIIVVTGFGKHRGNAETVRLYKHCDGYPTGNLAVLADATDMALTYLDENGEGLKFYTNTETAPGLDKMPAEAFSGFVLAATVDWWGMGGRIDNDWAPEEDTARRPAVYHEAFRPEAHLGNQGDLEWVYVVDMKERSIKVYGGDYGDPHELVGKGMTDPLSYADELREEAQESERKETTALVERLTAQGWSVNARPGWATSTVLSLLTAIKAEKAYDRLPVLADAAQEAGFSDETELAKLRGPKGKAAFHRVFLAAGCSMPTAVGAS